MKLWVKIPEKATVKSIIVCLASLIKQLHGVGPYRYVTNIRLNRQEKALEIEVDG